MKRILITLILSILSTQIFAQERLDEAFKCDRSTADFFSPLVQRQLLNPKAIVVVDSVNYFKPKLFKKLTVYGLPVIQVYGWADNQVMFIKSPGNQTPSELYGVVVREGVANVQAQLNSFGSKAVAIRVEEGQTAITCKVGTI